MPAPKIFVPELLALAALAALAPPDAADWVELEDPLQPVKAVAINAILSAMLITFLFIQLLLL